MKVYRRITDIREEIVSQQKAGRHTGFVPTMGALHRGHLTLVECSLRNNDLTAVSIFVNPTQFNNKEDLEKYPRRFEEDLALLEKAGVNYVFLPEVEEMYPEGEASRHYDFGSLDRVMEGVNRPGHFDGVATIVSKFFDAIPARRAYFGEKDYQQLLIIQSLVRQEHIPVEIIPCPIVREEDGLAMSSRNLRLTPEQRRQAPAIYRTLKQAKTLRKSLTVSELKNFVIEKINENSELETEYFEIACGDSLRPLQNWSDSPRPMGFAVVHAGPVRLIDNVELF